MADSDTAQIGRITTRRIMLRLVPLLGLIYMVAYIDRQNVAYAKLQMVDALGMSEAVYGLGAGLFFLGSFLFEVPSNLLLARVGARAWFARLMVNWGAVTEHGRAPWQDRVCQYVWISRGAVSLKKKQPSPLAPQTTNM